ncbi:MAG: DUF814 domain-containing protein [Spirochaetales bacterium]|nr:DUF814 domain-containing protein [Spirochaetales bacterium]
MSLNWKEIGAVLGELDIVGAQVQRVVQPSYDTLVLSLYKPGRSTELLFCVAHGACRIHETALPVPKADKPQRFMELLRSHVRGSRVEAIEQLGSERIVRLRMGHGDGERWLYARLWSGAANLILTLPDGNIVDALSRKPKRGEVAGGTYTPEAGPPPDKEFAIRDFPGTGSLNRRVDAWYAEHASELSLDALVEKARAFFSRKRAALDTRIAALERQATEYADWERYRQLGDILMANQSVPLSDGGIKADDFYRGGSVLIRIDPRLSVLDNATAYYEKAKKSKSGRAETESELSAARAALEALATDEQRVLAEGNPYSIRAYLSKQRPAAAAGDERRYPGLSLDVDGWRILIGRSAAENDALLRRHVRGNDLWLHARDYSGSYVFVKTRPGKSIPLPILLDAGMLAVYYSKARNQSAADLYYTQAKNLKRVKGGPKGLVLPQNEKNLRVAVDDKRLRELRRLIGKDGD